MNKKLLAVAVAGTFLAPAAALAQSSVTISGKAVASFGVYKVGGRAAGTFGHNSETQVRDESSTLIFSMREDLGGGLAAIAKYDLRPSIDTGNLSAQGEDFVGLTSPSWGTIQFGRFPLHYGATASFTGVHSGLMSNPTAIFDRAAVGATAIARQSRMDDVIRYGSPKFADMFEVVVAHSTSGVGSAALPIASAEADLRSANRKGSAWNVAPKLWGKNWEAGYSYWTAKPDVASAGAATTATTKQRGDSLYGWYKWGGLRVGLAWNKSKIDTTAAVTGVTTSTSNRTAWGIPISYNWGNHTIYADYFKAGNDKAVAAGSTKARLFGVTYAYDLSKRTAIAVSYAGIKNQANAAYNLFTGNAGLVAGEDPSTWNVVMGHRF
jgi:predicted porin